MRTFVTHASPSSSVVSTKSRVLLVDDHPIVRQGLSQLIDQTADLTVAAAVEDAAGALAQARANRPDVAIVDLTLKGSSGLDLIKDLKAMDATLPVLVLSMHDESLHAERALRAGAQGYVMKEEATETVLEAIRTVLRGEMYFSTAVTARLLQKLVVAKPGADNSPLHALTDREHEVFLMIGRGLPARDIAGKLGLSVKTIDAHRENIKSKLGFKSGSELSRYAMQYTIDNHGTSRAV
jgi:DNA-binding NarL/FixJ family response regulator